MNSVQKIVDVLSIPGNGVDSGSGQRKKLVMSPQRGNWQVIFEE
jgi:hypothetical protein